MGGLLQLLGQLSRRLRALGRHLTGANVGIIAVGSYLGGVLLALLTSVASGFYGSRSDTPARIALWFGIVVSASLLILWLGGGEADREEEEKAALQRPDSRAARVAQAQSLLQEAGDRISATLTDTTATVQKALDAITGIVDAVQAELNNSRATIDRLMAKAKAAEEMADAAQARAAVAEDSAKAIDELLKANFTGSEKQGQRWDLKLMAWNVPVGVLVGILSAIATYYIFHM